MTSEGRQHCWWCSSFARVPRGTCRPKHRSSLPPLDPPPPPPPLCEASGRRQPASVVFEEKRMTACSLAVLCNVERFLCSATQWGKPGGADLPSRPRRLEEPKPSDVLIPRNEEVFQLGRCHVWFFGCLLSSTCFSTFFKKIIYCYEGNKN